MSYKNKTYVAFDGDNDMVYYRMMQAWKAHEYIDFNFYDAHEINSARDTSTEDSIKAQLRDRMASAKQMILLVGQNTRFLRKFVPWEIELARKKDIPIIVANLNKLRGYDDKLCPSAIKDGTYTMNVSFEMKIIKFALETFPDIYSLHKNDTGYNHTYQYDGSLYKNLGL